MSSVDLTKFTTVINDGLSEQQALTSAKAQKLEGPLSELYAEILGNDEDMRRLTKCAVARSEFSKVTEDRFNGVVLQFSGVQERAIMIEACPSTVKLKEMFAAAGHPITSVSHRYHSERTLSGIGFANHFLEIKFS